jgi:hypothetical protein
MKHNEMVAKLREIADGTSYNMDGRLAYEFARLTGRPETELLGILREFIAWTASHTQGRGRYESAVRNCCDSFVKWFQDAPSYGGDDLISFIASHHTACVYAVLVGKMTAPKLPGDDDADLDKR